ncbi:MAG: hypothetical protein M5R36_21670 [Deltaproteobacteria bacterium]|nr:hypothetical protein [Deltaproteobacteria bacterium]
MVEEEVPSALFDEFTIHARTLMNAGAFRPERTNLGRVVADLDGENAGVVFGSTEEPDGRAVTEEFGFADTLRCVPQVGRENIIR